MSETKRISFRLPLKMWEELYRLYPDHGARTALMKMMVAELIKGPFSILFTLQSVPTAGSWHLLPLPAT